MPASRTPGRPPAEARDDEQDDGDEPGQPERRRPMRQEPRAEDRGDLEVRPAVGPGVVVRQPADERDDVAVAGDEVADEPDPAQPAADADEDRGDGRDRAAARSGCTASAQTTSARTAGEQGARREVDPDEVDAGDGRGDRAVEVGEPVVGQRHAGEVGDLGREVAGGDARPDRDVDEQVAPVPAAGDPAVGRLVPAVACRARARTASPAAAATIQAGASARSARHDAGAASAGRAASASELRTSDEPEARERSRIARR